MPYDEFALKLGPLETIDRRAFQPDKNVSKDLCNFVLALSLVHGDIMDLLLAHALLAEARPKEALKETPPWALWGGIALHVLRIQATVLHELLRLVRVNSRLLKNPALCSVLKRLPAPARRRWDAIVAAATDQPSRQPFAGALAIVRNKVASHYDAAQIGRAFDGLASSANPGLFMSRGPTLGASRFYFADAAADALLLQTNETKAAKKALLDPTELVEGIAATLFCLVTQFMDARGLNLTVRDCAPNNLVERPGPERPAAHEGRSAT